MSDPLPQGEARAADVQKMFTRIARRYDLMNHLMTAGQDASWRRIVVQCANLPAHGRLLDLGTGTGDLALETRRQVPSARIVAADFTLAMMRVGCAQQVERRLPPLDWCAADALHIPFPAATFDALISGFLMRNVSDLDQALQEQYRVLKPGARVVILDTTRPPANLLTPLIDLHFNLVIPTLGKLISGSREAYTYLPDTTRKFLTAEKLAERLAQNGFRQVAFRRLMLETVAIHWGVK